MASEELSEENLDN